MLEPNDDDENSCIAYVILYKPINSHVHVTYVLVYVLLVPFTCTQSCEKQHTPFNTMLIFIRIISIVWSSPISIYALLSYLCQRYSPTSVLLCYYSVCVNKYCVHQLVWLTMAILFRTCFPSNDFLTCSTRKLRV